jgi:hypothetical protein
MEYYRSQGYTLIPSDEVDDMPNPQEGVIRFCL